MIVDECFLYDGGRLRGYLVKFSCDGAGLFDDLPVCPECYEQSSGKFGMSVACGGSFLLVEYNELYYRVGK